MLTSYFPFPQATAHATDSANWQTLYCKRTVTTMIITINNYLLVASLLKYRR